MKEKLAMPCTEQQWEQEIKPRIEKIQGVNIESISSDWNCYRTITNYYEKENVVSNVNNYYINGAINIPYDPDRFCASLGEVKGFPEKWAVKDTEEATRFIEKLSNDGIFKPCGFGFGSERFNTGYLCFMSKNVDLRVFDPIQYGYTEVTLDQLKAHYEEQPKWMPLTRGGYEYKIIREDRGDGCINVEVLRDGIWWANLHYRNGAYIYNQISPYDLIPYNPKQEAIKQEIAIKEKELEELKGKLK